MSKWQHRDEGKKISKSVVASKTTQQLQDSKKFLKGLLDLRKSEKLAKTYIQGTKKAIAYNDKNKVFVDFRFDGTTTGRLSCAAYNAKKAMGVSFHTLPRSTETNIRSIFTAPKGEAFITVDYAAMELRVLSHIAKDGNMQKAFNQGADLHTYTGGVPRAPLNLIATSTYKQNSLPMMRTAKTNRRNHLRFGHKSRLYIYEPTIHNLHRVWPPVPLLSYDRLLWVASLP